ncbi:serine/threonine-protein kinase [Nocardiopsis sp. NPDC006832]|uniref:serine/threonine-protein kinase n=1 Tax=Nocardiopsis sp. NPDC006832 TaxID=3157188 RepID=UPI00340D2403
MFNGHDGPATPHSGDPTEIDGYRLSRRLGRGGMGTVYLAEDHSRRQVALKVVHPDLAENPSFRRRFAREVETARRVARFSTAGVIDARLEGDPLFVVSEFVPGPDLSRAVRERGPLRGGDLEGLAMGVAAALTAIHRSGVVHRDLKPANVLLSPVGPKVIDFGIARALDDDGGGITRSSRLMGTPSYIAPELLHGHPATPAADVFAWGCLVAFAGTGRTPFHAATVPAVLHNVTTAAPRLDGLDPALTVLVRQALDKNPANRPTAQAILDRLVGRPGVSEEEAGRTISATWTPPPVTATPPTQTAQGAGGPPTRRRGLLLGAGAGTGAVVLIAGLSFALAAGNDAPPEDLTTLYGSDFATDPGWGDSIYDEDDGPYDSGYAPGEGIVMAMDPNAEMDPSVGRNWMAPSAQGVNTTERLLVTSDVQVLEGYDYLTVGLRCIRDLHPTDAELDEDDTDGYPDHPDQDYTATYRAWLRADGAEAVIDKISGTLADDSWDPEELAKGEVSEFRPYPAVPTDGADQATSRGEEPEPVSNNIKLACEFTPGDEGEVPTAEIRMWVNDGLAVSAVDEEPYPDDYADHQYVQRQAVQYHRGQSTSPFRVLYENFRVERILDE